MPEFLHGAYGKINAIANRETNNGKSAMVIFGTAPVNTVVGGSKNVNKPVLLRSMGEAQEKFGYSNDWASFTLCEAFHRFFDVVGVGPIVAVNVLDCDAHKKDSKTTKSLTPVSGRVTILNADCVIVDTLNVAGKAYGTDYILSYDYSRGALNIIETAPGKLGTTALEVSYFEVDTAKVDNDAIIGTTDEMGLNTGLYAVKNVYQETGFVPEYILAPGWSSITEVHDVMKAVSRNINSHWNAWIIADLPLVDGEGTALNMVTVSAYKKNNGYTAENETVCWPMTENTDGKKYHLSVLRAANHLAQLIEDNGAPYHTASNTPCEDISNIYMGEEMRGRNFSDELINKYLNAYGITSATFAGGRWVLWGASAADYDQDNADAINVGETCRMMLYHISNDFQIRRTRSVDKPMSVNDILSVAAQEQERLDALVSIGALTYAKVVINAKLMEKTDIMNGDWTFDFSITNTPLAKSLTARVTWVDNGFQTYIDAVEAAE